MVFNYLYGQMIWDRLWPIIKENFWFMVKPSKYNTNKIYVIIITSTCKKLVKTKNVILSWGLPQPTKKITKTIHEIYKRTKSKNFY